jgi:hypothetical protein
MLGCVVVPLSVPFDFSKLAASPRIGLNFALLQQPGAESPDYGEQVDDILALLAGTYRTDRGRDVATPVAGTDTGLARQRDEQGIR